MKQVLGRFKDNEIPLDTQVADIDHFDKRKDFTIDPINWSGLPQYFEDLHRMGMKTVLLLGEIRLVIEIFKHIFSLKFKTTRNRSIHNDKRYERLLALHYRTRTRYIY